MNKLQLLYEYDKGFFSYSQMESGLWRDLVVDAKKSFNIFFDLENDYTKKVQRIIEIPQTEWEHRKCKFKCEMYSAGGDWEMPIIYFRCQLIDGYAFELSTYGKSHFIFIPGKTEGNSYLVKGKKESWIAPDNNDYKKGIDPEIDETKCWSSLKDYLKDLVDKEIELRQSKRENNDSI